MTVGKIYGGLLIFENWKATKFGNVPFPKVLMNNLAIWQPRTNGSQQVTSSNSKIADNCSHLYTGHPEKYVFLAKQGPGRAKQKS